MNSSIITSDTYQLGATSAYTTFLPRSEGSVLFGTTNKLSYSWKKFIRVSSQPEFESSVTFILAAKTTTEGPTVLKPTPTEKELLSGPLFQVAGMFAIDEPGWADKHDEYLAETYLENHAESK